MKRTKKLICLLLAVVMALTCACSPAAVEDGAAETPEYAGVYEEIAASLSSVETLSDWQTFGLAAYGIVSGKEAVSAEKKEAYVTAAISSVSADEPYVTDLAKAEIILGALGVDTTALPLGEGETLDNRSLLANVSEFETYSDAIWALLAYESAEIEISGEVLTRALDTVSANMNDEGLLFGTYGDYQYTDIDSTGAAIGALARFVRDEEDTYGIRERATGLSDKMLAALSENQSANGSYGSACTDAFVMIGLISAGIDPELDTRFVKGEGDEAKSLVDGLLSYTVEGGFSGWDGSLDLEWSTEQGFRALVSLSAFKKGEGAPFNLYNIKPVAEEAPDNPDNPDIPEIPDNPDEPTTPPSTPPAIDDKISVNFTMVTHKETWIEKHPVRLETNTSVRDLIVQVFDEYGVESKGLSSGYLRSVTYKGETLREFGIGRNSGWQYTVDGELPMLGITQYKLSGGEDIVLKFTADYTGGSLSGSVEEKEEKEEEVKEESVPESEAVTYTDVSESEWFAGSVSFVSEKGFMTGVSAGKFAPQLTLTRAMFVTVLHRMAGKPEGAGNEFSDVVPGAWYTDAVSWAYANGIVSGVGVDMFSPDAPITREQMATLIYRYARYAGMESKAQESEYTDGGAISQYAKEAVGFAEAAGIMQGDGGKFRPKDNSKRCEAAAVFERLYNLTVQ